METDDLTGTEQIAYTVVMGSGGVHIFNDPLEVENFLDYSNRSHYLQNIVKTRTTTYSNQEDFINAECS